MGLYLGQASVCPPEPYLQITQPVFPGYGLRGAQAWQALDAPGGTGLAGRRFLAAFGANAPGPPVTVAGWFIAARLSDDTLQTLAVEPFPGGLVLGQVGRELNLNLSLSAAPTGLAAGQDVVSVASAAFVSTGASMAFLYKRQQRENQKTTKKAIMNALGWDDNINNLSPRSTLSRTAIFPDTAIPGGTPVATWRELANALVGKITSNLAAVQPPPP